MGVWMYAFMNEGSDQWSWRSRWCIILREQRPWIVGEYSGER